MGSEGLVGPDLPLAESLFCVLEQDTLSASYFSILLVQLRKTGNCADMTENC